MGYFSNGSECDSFRAAMCDKCWHDRNQNCPIWLAHLIHNYEDCNKKDSILHLLIPRNGIHNGDCKLFVDKSRVA